MTEEKRPLKVFLCHASGDKLVVRALYQRLIRDGVDAWLDKEKLLPGQDWQLEIPKAVRESDVVIVCLSKKSITKEGYVQKEIKFALDIADEKPEGTIFLIPARLEECDVPSKLGLRHWVDLFDVDGYERLMRSLQLRADKLGLSAGDTFYTDPELEQRLDQLYTEGLAALWVEDWDKAQYRFQAILREKPDHIQAIAKLDEAKRQKYLNALYTQALDAQAQENWQAMVDTLEKLVRESADYKDTTLLLKDARRRKQLLDLYEEARKLYAAHQWQAVVRVFTQIAAMQPNYPDPAGLLPSSEKEVEKLRQLALLNELYGRGVREMDDGHWYEARRLLEQVHKTQTGFFETERLLKKVENEIAKIEELNKRNIYIDTLYEQAHGLVRSQNWREALDKIQEIQKLDNQFEDKDGIAERAKTALELEEEKVRRQNQLAAMYAETVSLLKDRKYQEVLEKWQDIRDIDPKYPDRQGVQRTARRKLVELNGRAATKPLIYINKKLTLSIIAFFGFFSMVGLVVFVIVKMPPFLPFPLTPVKQTSTVQPTNTLVPPTPTLTASITHAPATPTLEKDLTAADYGKLIYDENFDNVNGWNDLVGSKLENGNLVIGPGADAVPKAASYTDFIFESRFLNPSGLGAMGYYLRFQNPPCSNFNCSIQVAVDFQYSNVVGREVRSSQFHDITPYKHIAILPAQWNKLTVKVKGDEYTVYFNDHFILNFTDDRYASGSFVLDNYKAQEIRVDYIRIYDLPAP